MYNQFYPNYTPIQQFQPQTPQASFYFVKSMDELSGFRAMPNVYCIGINKDNKEIYIRRMNNDGNIEVETYNLKSEGKEQSELEKITERLSAIENTLREKNNERFNGYANQQLNQQQTQYNATNANFQPNDVR